MKQAHRFFGQHPEGGKRRSYASNHLAISDFRRCGLVNRTRLSGSRQIYISLTERALAQLGQPYEPYTPENNSQFAHKLFLTDLRLHMEGKYGRSIGWQSDRSLLQDRGSSEDKSRHSPDSICEIEERIISLEAELSKKNNQRLDEALLHNYMSYDQTAYICPDPKVLGKVRQRARAIDPDFEHFRIYDRIELA